MQTLEIVPSDPDVKEMTFAWTDDGSSVFITQIDSGGVKQTVMVNVEEAKQTIAALTAFVAGPLPHASDCALHNSPAEPIAACSCR